MTWLLQQSTPHHLRRLCFWLQTETHTKKNNLGILFQNPARCGTDVGYRDRLKYTPRKGRTVFVRAVLMRAVHVQAVLVCAVLVCGVLVSEHVCWCWCWLSSCWGYSAKHSIEHTAGCRRACGHAAEGVMGVGLGWVWLAGSVGGSSMVPACASLCVSVRMLACVRACMCGGSVGSEGVRVGVRMVCVYACGQACECSEDSWTQGTAAPRGAAVLLELLSFWYSGAPTRAAWWTDCTQPTQGGLNFMQGRICKGMSHPAPILIPATRTPRIEAPAGGVGWPRPGWVQYQRLPRQGYCAGRSLHFQCSSGAHGR